jgi:hypothetical protein
MERDFDFDYFGFRTLERSYLMSVSPEAPPAERQCRVSRQLARLALPHRQRSRQLHWL